MRRAARAHIVALVAALATIVVVSALWIANLRMGPAVGGWLAGPMVVFVPFGVVVVTAFWLIVRGLLHGRVRWRALTVLAAAGGLALVVVAGYCGPLACFMPGPNRLMGWFLVVGVALTALVHHLVLDRFPPEPDNG